ncbi:MAG: DUF349 domain-containing protein [Erysipelotrichaceae bacterium]|nr:DUF349 domain-containing protein [Erysipelotrichaceae bacterium]
MGNDIRQDLIEQGKALLESEDAAEAYVKAKALSRKWPRIHEDEESFLDIELSEKFNNILDELSKKAGEVAVNTEERKQALIEEAKKALENTSIEKANRRMKELMDSWKASGRTQSKEKDDELWAQFSEVRKAFFDKRKEYYDNLHETFANNKVLKEELIGKAKEILEMKDMRKASNAVTELFEEWRKTGSAGRESDESLWKEFSSLRKEFFKKRERYYDGLKETFAKNTEAKKELIARAKVLLARGEFTEEEISEIKDLRRQWKEVGNAGRENEQTLWEEFNTLVNKYFENMKFYK